MQCCPPRKPDLHIFVKDILALLAFVCNGKTLCENTSKSILFLFAWIIRRQWSADEDYCFVKKIAKLLVLMF